MAFTKEISMTMCRTLSDGNYGSIKIEVSETVALGRYDTSATEYRKLIKRLGVKFRSARANAMRPVKGG